MLIKKLLFGRSILGDFRGEGGGGGNAKLLRNICLLNIYLFIKNWHHSLSRSNNWFLRVSGGWCTTNYVKMSVDYLVSTDMKTNRHPKLSRLNNWFLGGGTLKLLQNICLLNICTSKKNWRVSLSRSKNWFLRGLRRMVHPNYVKIFVW